MILPTKIYNTFLLLGCIVLMSCNDVTEQEQQAVTTVSNVDNDYTKSQAFKDNKQLIKTYYDTIGYHIIDVILKDRVYEKQPEKRPKLDKIPLDHIPDSLSKPSEAKVKLYAQRLINFRSNVALNHNDNTTKKFTDAVDTLLKSSFFKDTIITKNKENDSIYLALQKGILSEKDRVLNVIAENNERIDEVAQITIPNDHLDTNTESNQLKDYYWLWIVLLALCIVLMFLQRFFYKSNIKKLKQKRITKPSNNLQDFQMNPRRLNSSEVHNIITDYIKKLKATLVSQMGMDFSVIIEERLNKLTSDVSQAAAHKTFDSKETLSSFLQSYLDAPINNLKIEMGEYVTKETALSIFNSKFQIENIIAQLNTTLISEDEIQENIQTLKEACLAEYTFPLKKSEYTLQLEEIRQRLHDKLLAMIQNRSIVYFPFSNPEGLLNDTKRSTTIQRDSAIKLTLDSNDTSQATFTLLYEKSEMMKAGIMSYDALLLPICEFKSSDFNSRGTTIQQIGPDGTMFLEDGYWKVNNKLKIKVI